MIKKLNLGVGHDTLPDHINVDIRPLSGVDVVCDLDERSWPFGAGSVAEIRATDIFEHLADVITAMDECHRILKNSGTLFIRGPLAGGPNVWSDVTHRRAFTPTSFDHFDPGTVWGKKYNYGRGKWRILQRNVHQGNVTFFLERRNDTQ